MARPQIPVESLPPLKTTVAVDYRHAGHEAWPLWGVDDVLYRYHIRIAEIARPIPAVRIRYLSPPDINDARSGAAPLS